MPTRLSAGSAQLSSGRPLLLPQRRSPVSSETGEGWTWGRWLASPPCRCTRTFAPHYRYGDGIASKNRMSVPRGSHALARWLSPNTRGFLFRGGRTMALIVVDMADTVERGGASADDEYGG